MPQYVSLAQQGFFEPFQALGKSAMAAAGLLQQQSQFAKEQALKEQQQKFAQDQFNQTTLPRAKIDIDEAALNARQKKAADVLNNHDFNESLGPVVKSMADSGVAGTPIEPDTAGLDPQAAAQFRATTPIKLKPVDLNSTAWEDLGPDLQRFAVGQVNAKAEKTGAGEISRGAVAQAYRAQQIAQYTPRIPGGMTPVSLKANMAGQPTEYEYRATDTNGGPIATPDEQLKTTQELSKEARGKFDDYNASNDAYTQIQNHVTAAEKETGVGNETGPRDKAILSSYLATVNPKIRLTPGAAEDLEKNSSSFPQAIRVKLNKIAGGTGTLSSKERQQLLAAAHTNTLAHYNSAKGVAQSIADQGSSIGAGQNSALRIMPRVNAPTSPGEGNQRVAPAQGDGTQPGTASGGNPRGLPTLWSADQVKSHRGAFIWGPTGQQGTALGGR